MNKHNYGYNRLSASSSLLWLALLFVSISLLKIFAPFFKGKVGEFTVQLHLHLYLKDPRYILLNDLTFTDEQGKTTQIDHILLSPFGIFVIETKNYKGWIFGSEKQKIWTQKIFKKTYKFQNPLHQNYRHLKVLESILSDIVDPLDFQSLVVFMPDAQFKTTMPKNVFKGASWVDYVKSFDQLLFSEQKIKQIQARLETEALEKSWKTNRDHVNQLRQQKENSET